MRRHVAFQMDPMESVDINGDTTFALAETAQARNWTMWEYGPEHLVYDEGKILAYARPMTVQRDPDEPGLFGERELIDLGKDCLLYTSPSPRDQRGSRMPSSA